jgi:periplasmic divalent cation tolerance protein
VEGDRGEGEPVSGRVVVLCTVGRPEDAERIAREVVERRLAACVNVVPSVVSTYRWKGKVERDEERLLVIKTRADRFEALRAAIVSLHPYEVPEVVALPISEGHAPYLEWVDESVRG